MFDHLDPDSRSDALKIQAKIDYWLEFLSRKTGQAYKLVTVETAPGKATKVTPKKDTANKDNNDE